MYKATREFSQYLTEKEIKYRVEENEERSLVEVQYEGENLPAVTVNFYSTDDDNDVVVVTDPILTVPEQKVQEILYLINKLNKSVRFIKIVMDGKRQIVLSADVPQKTANVAEVCMEMLARAVRIADEAYLTLCRAIFGPGEKRPEQGEEK